MPEVQFNTTFAVLLILLEAEPTIMVYSPGSAFQSFLFISQKEKSFGVRVICTVLLSPGLRNIFRNPFNSFTGRSTDDFLSWTYNWAISAPATRPVFRRAPATAGLYAA